MARLADMAVGRATGGIAGVGPSKKAAKNAKSHDNAVAKYYTMKVI
jgi:hypothetical protein